MTKLIQLFLSSVLFSGVVLQGATVTAQQTTAPALSPSSGSNSSYNWAGYIAQGGGFTSVGGTWNVSNSSESNLSADTSWVGIGGVTSQDLIQAGVQTVNGGNGQTIYQAWYELLPSDSQQVPISISPGDSMTISITKQANNQWLLSFKDNTNGQSYQTTVTYSSSLSSAEWIVEMPVSGRSFIPLDNFGTVSFSNLWAVKNGNSMTPSESGARAVTMINSSNQVLAQPTSLGTSGASFSVSRTSSDSVSVQTTTPSVSVITRKGFRRRGISYLFRDYYRGEGLSIQLNSNSGFRLMSFDSD